MFECGLTFRGVGFLLVEGGEVSEAEIASSQFLHPELEMAATGILPFIRGVDLSGNDFKVSR